MFTGYQIENIFCLLERVVCQVQHNRYLLKLQVKFQGQIVDLKLSRWMPSSGHTLFYEIEMVSKCFLAHDTLQCSTDCGMGEQDRRVYCVQLISEEGSGYRILPNTNCSVEEQPANAQQCVGTDCQNIDPQPNRVLY